MTRTPTEFSHYVVLWYAAPPNPPNLPELFYCDDLADLDDFFRRRPQDAGTRVVLAQVRETRHAKGHVDVSVVEPIERGISGAATPGVLNVGPADPDSPEPLVYAGKEIVR